MKGSSLLKNHWPWFLALLPAILTAGWSWQTGRDRSPQFLTGPSFSLLLRDTGQRIYGFEERRFGDTIAFQPIPQGEAGAGQPELPISGHYRYQTTLHFRTFRPALQQMCFVILGDHPMSWSQTSVTLQGRAWPWIFLLLAAPVGFLFMLRRPLARVLRLPQRRGSTTGPPPAA